MPQPGQRETEHSLGWIRFTSGAAAGVDQPGQRFSPAPGLPAASRCTRGPAAPLLTFNVGSRSGLRAAHTAGGATGAKLGTAMRRCFHGDRAPGETDYVTHCRRRVRRPRASPRTGRWGPHPPGGGAGVLTLGPGKDSALPPGAQTLTVWGEGAEPDSLSRRFTLTPPPAICGDSQRRTHRPAGFSGSGDANGPPSGTTQAAEPLRLFPAPCQV